MKSNELTARNLKAILWETLQKLKSNEIKPAEADAIAIQSREIVRVVRSQESIIGKAGRQITLELIEYAEN